MATAAAAPTNPPPPSNAAALSAGAAGEARFFANAVANWYFNTIDPYAPHAQNVESRLRHPVHVVTRRILYGAVHAAQKSDVEAHVGDLEGLFNDDDAEIKDGPEALTRRTAARMEAFLASCAVALREDEEIGEHMGEIGEDSPTVASPDAAAGVKAKKNGKAMGKKKQPLDGPPPAVAARARSTSSAAPRSFRQIDRGDLLFRLELYCRT